MNNTSHMTYSSRNGSLRKTDMNAVRNLLVYLDPDMDYANWIRVLMAIYNESGGDDEGFEMANDWSEAGMKYKGEKEIRSKWRSFGKASGKPITIGTLKYMMRHQPS